ncbi:hypothetical protein HY375_00005, partial [Candidatus Berkelbacteria bacterium]|nr:hypothetical protein [Candidatus Berkelbacteria bacterium]
PHPVTPEQSIIGQTIFSINDYRHGQTAPSASQIREYRATQPAPTPAVRRPSLALPTLPALGQQLGRNPLWQSKTLGMTLLAGALIVILLINLRALSSKRETEQQAAAHAAELVALEDQLEEAKLAKVFNQPDKARASFQAVLTGADDLVNTTVAAEAALLASDAQAELDELTVTTRLTKLTELASIQDGSALSLWDGQLSVLGADGSLLTVPLTGGETSTVTAPSSAPPVATTAFDEKIGLAVLTSAPSVLELATASGPTAPLALTNGSWKAGTALAPFFNTLYVLAPADNQIWKFASTNGQFQAPVGYVEDGTAVSGAVDLAIDGSVYVLLGDGQIRKFSRGKVTEFPLRDIPEPAPTFTAPTQLLTTRDGDALYVLDGHRVVVLDKTGRFQRQYAFAPELGDVTRIAITPDETTLVVLTPTALYSTPL